MFLACGICLSLAAFCSAVQPGNYNKNYVYLEEPLYKDDASSSKRSALIIGPEVLIGMRAVRNLLSGAKKLISPSPTRNYYKPGGYYQAAKDFKEASPKNVQTFRTKHKTIGRIGDVGDKQLILRYNGQDRVTTLEIRELESTPIGKLAVVSGKVTDKISYPEANQMFLFE